MKKYIYNIYLLAALFLVATACTKEDSVLDSSAVEKEQPVNNTYTMTVDASLGEDVATTRALSLDGTTLKSTWEVNDEVTVYNETQSADLGGTLKAQSAGASTTLSGTLSGTIENGDVLTLKFRSPNYASQNGTLAYIAANCDYAKADVTVSSVDGGNVTTTGAAHFANQQAIVKFTLLDKGNSDAPLDETTKLAITIGSNSYTITPTSAPKNELFVAIPGFSGQITLNAIVGTNVYTYTKTSATFANSQYYTVRVKMTQQGTIEIGKLIGQNGCIYANAAAATSAGTTAAGMIAYVGNASDCTNGLAIALADEAGDKSLPGAKNAAKTKNETSLPVVGGTWRVPTKVDWQNMFTQCGDNYDEPNWTTTGLRGKLQTVSADIVMGNSYWANTPSSSGFSYILSFGSSTGAYFQGGIDNNSPDYKARAVLAF